MTSREHVIACARSFLGVRFAHQGRSAQHGLDCLGLLLVSAQKAGICLQGCSPLQLDRRDYGTWPDQDFLQEMLSRYLAVTSHPEPGDVVLLRIEGRAQHLALISNYPEPGELGMIHAYAPARRVVEHRFDEHWQQRLHATYRLPH